MHLIHINFLIYYDDDVKKVVQVLIKILNSYKKQQQAVLYNHNLNMNINFFIKASQRLTFFAVLCCRFFLNIF